MPTWVYWTIGLLGAAVSICICLIKAKNKEINDLRSSYNSHMDKARSFFISSVSRQYANTIGCIAKEHQQTLNGLPSGTKVNFRDPFPLDFYEDFDNSSFPFELPYGVTITKTGEAALGYISSQKPFGEYTVYTTYSGRCYHRSPYCNHITLSFPTCIFSAARTKTPCFYCCPPSLSSIPKWYLNFLNASRFFGIQWSKIYE